MVLVQCVAVIIENPDGEILLNLREDNSDIAFPNCWTLPGGRVESDETPEQAAIREMREETGLRLPISFWKVYERRRVDLDVVIEQHIFVAKTDVRKPKLVLGEGQELRFFRKEKISSLPFAFGFGILLGEVFDDRQSVGGKSKAGSTPKLNGY